MEDRYGPRPRRVDEMLTPRAWRLTSVAVIVATAILCLACWWGQMSRASVDFMVGTLLLLVLTAIAWSITSAVGALLFHRWRLTLIAPAVAAVGIAGAFSSLPDRAGWALSKGSMERAATECSRESGGERLGVYRIDRMVRRDGGCLLYEEFSLVSDSGFGYFPAGAPPERAGNVVYTPFEGPWYRFQENF